MIITARYPGRCSICHRPIVVGDPISWTKGSRIVEHAECSAEGRAQAVAIEASKATDAKIDVPAPAGREYLPFQLAGIAYAMARQGTLIADDMGLGKTIQAIGRINADPSIESVLVICPKSLTINWQRECRRWLARDLPVSTNPRAKRGVVIVGYDQAVGLVETVKVPGKKPRKMAHPIPALDHPWDMVVPDEIHLCKNHKTQRTQVVSALMVHGRIRLGLTGTPIVNRPMELWPIVRMIDPANWVEKCGYGRFRGRYGSGLNSKELQDRLRATCMIRRLKADVLKELPPKRRQVVELPATEETRELVAAEVAAWDSAEEAREELRIRVELAKASEDPAEYVAAVAALRAAIHVGFEQMSLLRHSTALAKVPYVIEHVRAALEDDPGAKICVFAHHHDVIDAIQAGLADFGAVQLTGDDSVATRQATVDRFQDCPECRVFVGGIQAAGVGITLTASSHVVFGELDWVPGNLTQAEDRVHRISQLAESILVQHLVLEGSLDARMAEVIVAKQAIIDRSLDKQADSSDLTPLEKRPEIADLDVAAYTSKKSQPATSGPRAELDRVAETLTPERIALIHEALQRLALVCDGARRLDGSGFNRLDAGIGKSLAMSTALSPRQAALGLKLVRTYQGQLGALANQILDSADLKPAKAAKRERKPSPTAQAQAEQAATEPPAGEASPVTPDPEPEAPSGTSNARAEGKEPTMHEPSASANYVIRITATDAHHSLIDVYDSFSSVDKALERAVGHAKFGEYYRVDYAVTHVESGSTFVGRYALAHPDTINPLRWQKISLAAHTRAEATRLAEHYASLGLEPLNERAAAYRAWAARLSPATRVRRAA
jgi:SWI/SNF-related matrix-associated actin-dependent regulator 1 of chromatin subfamily A